MERRVDCFYECLCVLQGVKHVLLHESVVCDSERSEINPL
jgi:hypothetical protein